MTSPEVQRRRGSSLLKGFLFLFFLYLFLLAISLMGSSFKLLGSGLAQSLIMITSNPFVSLFIGILTTSLVQSSSVTTSMIVGLVSGGMLTIDCAIPMVMGANIGTSVTATIVSVGHISRNDEFERAFAAATVHDFFNIISVAVLLPLELATGFLKTLAMGLTNLFYGTTAGGSFQSPLKAVLKPVIKAVKNGLIEQFSFSPKVSGIIMVILAVGLIFLSLAFIVKISRRAMATRVEHILHRIFGLNAYLTIFFGMVITATIQSSSITTSIMIPLAGAGIITLAHVFPLTIGANIGTTITALIASLAGNKAGLTIAFVHLFFNISGTVLLYPLPPLRAIPMTLARQLARHTTGHKKLALVYIVTFFFIVPLVLIFLSKL